MIFQNREEAGDRLAHLLKKYKKENTLILALPRGGVPVAARIAKYLNAPLDVLVVRKIGSPNNKELAIGAIAPGGVSYLDKLNMINLNMTTAKLNEITLNETIEMNRRQKAYRGDQPPLTVKGKTIILVDDGIATGATIKAAIRSVKKQKPEKLIVAVPVCSPEIAEDIKLLVDEFECLENPDPFTAVGTYYFSFPQITDEEVKSLLNTNH